MGVLFNYISDNSTNPTNSGSEIVVDFENGRTLPPVRMVGL